MHANTPVVEKFFEQFAQGRTALDIDLIASQYPESFMMAGPKGARATQKPTILAALDGARGFLNASGHTSTSVMSLEQTALDAQYVLARVLFRWRFERLPAPPIDVEVHSTFILSVSESVPKIVFQLEHEDFQESLRAHGVLSAKPAGQAQQ